VKDPSIAVEWFDKSLPRFEAKHVCRIGYIENLTANNACCRKEDERDGLLEQNASLKLKRLHFEPGYKRLEKDKFFWPDSELEVVDIDSRQMSWLLAGLEIDKAHQRLFYNEI